MWLLLFSALTYLAGIALIIFVVMQRKEPAATFAWILIIVTLPVVGVLLFLWLGYARIERKVQKRMQSHQAIADQLKSLEEALIEGNIVPKETLEIPVQAALAGLAEGSHTFAVTHGNALSVLTNPEESFVRLEELITRAHDSIHMLYYIFRRDETGRRIRDLLIEAAKRGIEVRLLVDGVGSWTLGDVFTQPLIAAGAQFARYLPVTFLGRPWHWNLRNHRKITVVDGLVGMMGSANIGNEYRKRSGSKTDFYDYQILCEGPVVQELQEVFASDWFFATRENLIQTRYFPLTGRVGSSIAQIVTSGPDDPQYRFYASICTAIHAAKERVRIVSPYFIPDQALLVALRTAAMRGVSVQMILARNFSTFHEHIIFLAGRSYYDDLLHSGIEIYEYEQGFLHAKSITVDRAWASVGTANMDIRSFRLNFEVNMNIYSKETVSVLNQQFEGHLKACRKINLESFGKRSIGVKCAENTFRVFSPIL
jgi:cardiolipin synthase A/B